MCGVAGIFSYHYSSPSVDRNELRKIRDHMTARGPDGKGEWYSKNNRVALGHRRLAIIDLSDDAAQPMTNDDGSLIISYNGEIYNYKTLRQELQLKGYRFRSHSDTEVLLHLYAEKGEAMLHDLRGMFAFALWDEKKQAMFMARDPYGIKPLYYADDGWTLRLASQVKAIVAGGKVSSESEPAGIVGFYLLGSVPEPYTIYQDIRAVPAGSFIWVDNTGPRKPVQYFSIARVWAEAEERDVHDVDIQAEVRKALLDSVRHHMVSDVPVGAFLSAGIDSGALVGLMTELQSYELSASSPQPSGISTITLAFEEYRGQHNDESPLAEKVAKQYGTQHTTRYVTEKEFQEDLPKILEAMDQPTIDGINTWFVAKAAKEKGLKVAISGLGGDELFGGYPSFLDIPRWVRLLWLPSRVPGMGIMMEKAQSAFPMLFSGLNPKAAGMIRYGGDYAGAYILRRGLFLPEELKKIIDSDLVADGLRRLQLKRYVEHVIEKRPISNFGKVATMESALYMRNQLLRDTDWASMAHSLEIRVPLVDSRLVRQLTRYLVSQKAINQKELLAQSPRSAVLEVVSKRKKTGFTTPINKWLQNIKTAEKWQLPKTLTQKNCPWARRWAYTILET